MGGIAAEFERLEADENRPISGAFATAVLRGIRDAENDEFRDYMRTFYTVRPLLPAAYALRLMLTSWQNQVMDRPGYPEEVSAERCVESLNGRGPFALSLAERSTFIGDLLLRDLNTPVPQRAAFRRFVEIIMADRLGESPTGYDVGASDNSNIIRSAIERPFHRVDVQRRAPGASQSGYDERPTTVFNSILATPHMPGRWIGLDLIDPTWPENAHWIKACRQPEEIGTWQKHDELLHERIDPARVGFAMCNFARADQVAAVVARHGTVDVVNFSFSWSQGDALDRRAKFDNALGCLNAGGLMVFLEPARLCAEPPYLEVDWSAFGGFVYDPSRERMFHIADFGRDGRCGRVALLPDCADLAAGSPYQADIAHMLVE